MDACIDIQSVAVCGSLKMERFLKSLLKRNEDKRRVTSLFLTHKDSTGCPDPSAELGQPQLMGFASFVQRGYLPQPGALTCPDELSVLESDRT